MTRIRHRFRSAISGRWVTKLFARSHESTTVEESYLHSSDDTRPLPVVKP